MREFPMDQLGDAQLMELIYQGDQRAEKVLYQRYATYTTTLALRFVGNRALAEDIAQDVWVSLHSYLKRRGPVEEFKSYLAATTINRSRRVVRKQHNDISLDASALSYLEESETHSFASDEDPSRKLECDDLLRSMVGVMSRLSSLEYIAVRMRYFEDCSYVEIGDVLGKTESHARLITHRAIYNLRKNLINEKKM